MRPASPHDEELNAIERTGLNYMRRLSQPVRSAVRHWTRSALEKISQIERSTIIQAALFGVASGAIIGGSELGLNAWFGDDQGGPDLRDQWPYWAWYLGIALVVSALEIGLLYWRILVAAARLTTVAGLDLDREDTQKMMALGLSRAALDIPNPRAPLHGVDPYARLPRWKLLAYAIAYRVKVGATSVVLRLLLRRILARAALRSLIPLSAIVVYAAWNALIAYWIMREVRHRAAGPTAMQDLAELTAPDRDGLDPDSGRLVVQAVAESIIRSRDAHPNYVLFMGQVIDWFELDPDQLDYDWQARQQALDTLDECGRRVLLRTLSVATVLNGRPRKQQRALLHEVAGRFGRRVDPDALKRLQHAFGHGQGVPAATVDAVTAARLE